jgi:uncharacterized protein (TIGR02611 family)
MSERPKPEAVERVERRRERHRQRSKAYRVAWVVAAFVIAAAGIVMTGPVPGPGVLVLAVGLAMLALEFDWAQRLLDKALERWAAARESAGRMKRTHKTAAVAAAVLVLAAFVVAAVLWDLPLLPL